MSTDSGSAAYLANVRSRLDSSGYSWIDAGASFAGAARLKRFQLTKFGMWETFFVFREFDRLGSETLQRFTHEAKVWAFDNRGVGLARGLFAGLSVFGVALAQWLDGRVAQSVRESRPRRHWAAIEMPAVYDAGTGRLVYFEGTPAWGAAYYSGLRKQLTDILSPA